MKSPGKKIQKINIRDIFREKSPGLARIIPGFIYRYIHRIMHLDFINEILKKYGNLEGIDFVNNVIEDFNVKEKIYGLDNIPEKGKFIFASNHPLGGFDALILMKTVYKKIGGLYFLVNDILMNITNLHALFIPLNKHGKNSREVTKALNIAYKSDSQILIFPSGLTSRKIKGQIVDLEWKKHFISKAIEYKRDVIPVFIGGRNSNHFYNIANIRKFFRIKWNLEMFFLPDESFRHRNKDVIIYFGKPISYHTFDRSISYSEWAEYIKRIVYELPKGFNTEN